MSELNETRKCFVDNTTEIIQSNYLIEHKPKMSLCATQLLYTITAMVNKEDKDFKDYMVDVNSFSKLWNIDIKCAYDTLKQASTELVKKSITREKLLSTGKRKYESISLISYCSYEEGKGFAIIRFDPAMREHYLQLKNCFTKFSQENLYNLTLAGAKSNTFRIYELLVQYKLIGKRVISVYDFKKILGLIELSSSGKKIIKEKYKNNADFKRYVLEPAKQLINAATNINIDYSIEGRGKYAKMIFLIHPTNPKTLVENNKSFFNYSDIELNIEIEDEL